jgi:hypothetical protein
MVSAVIGDLSYSPQKNELNCQERQGRQAVIGHPRVKLFAITAGSQSDHTFYGVLGELGELGGSILIAHLVTDETTSL